MGGRQIVPVALAFGVLALTAPSAVASGTLSVSKRAIAAGDTRVAVGDEAGTVTGSYLDKTGPGESETVTPIMCGSACSTFIVDDEGACPPEDSCPVSETVNLSTTTGGGWSFAGWSGTNVTCPGTGGCSVTIPTGSGAANNRTVTVTYQDVQDPTVTLTAPPAGPRRDTALPVEAGGADNWRIAAVEFLLDGDVVDADSAPADGFKSIIDVQDLGQGASFTIGVRSVDPADRKSAIVSRTYTVDRAAPVPRFTSGPPSNAIVGAPEATFGFSATGDSPVAWACRLDGAAFQPCTSGSSYHVGGLADGPHTVVVRATDVAGNSAETSRAFTVNAVRPGVVITDGPAEGGIIRQRAATIRFTASGGTADCSLDSAAFRACSGPGLDSLSGLGDGAYTFRVRVRDEVGDEVLASRTFRVDTSVPPEPPKRKRVLNPTLSTDFDAYAGYTIYHRLALKRVPAGATVRVTCKGRKCPAKRFSRKRAGTVKLRRLVRRRLRPGTVLTIRVTKPDSIGKQFVIKIRKRKEPKLTITQIG